MKVNRTGRILITGSRDWDDEYQIREALAEAYNDLGAGPAVILVSGACPTGADKICEDVWHGVPLPVERHPADWDNCEPGCNPAHRRARNGKSYCPKAGFTRNQKMVDLGADICLAFIKNNSKGASMTADLAEKAGIPVRRYTA